MTIYNKRLENAEINKADNERNYSTDGTSAGNSQFNKLAV